MKVKIKNLLKNIEGFRILYSIAILAIAVECSVSLLYPVILKYSIDNIIGKEVTTNYKILEKLIGDNLLKAGLIMFLFTIVSGISLFIKGKFSAKVSESVAKNLKDKLFTHLQNVKYSYYSSAETGDLIQRCTSDVDTVRNFFDKQFLEIVNVIIMITVSIIFMLKLNVKLTLMTLIILPFLIAFTVVFFRNIEKTFKKFDEAEGRLSTVLQENLNGVRVVKAFAKEKFEIDKFEVTNSECRKNGLRILKLFAIFWSVSDAMVMLQIALILFVGIHWTVNGSISLGTLVAFLTYQGMLLYPIRQFGRVVADFGKSIVSIGRITEILEEPLDESHEEAKLHNIQGNICFKDVSFSYDKKVDVLKNINFEVKQGETVGILGPTGSGKSTLVHLLTHLFTPTSGKIYIDNMDMELIDKKWLRQNIGLILQEPFLYTKTIKENIGIVGDYNNDERIFEAASIANIHKGITEFKEGYNTLVGEKGLSLSGGQKQRISIARTIMKNAKVLIFDDSLSALDTETDASIRKELKERNDGTTKFIISHRISSLQEADKIIVLEDGQITQQGNHNKLINEEGLYKRIWTIQNAF